MKTTATISLFILCIFITNAFSQGVNNARSQNHLISGGFTNVTFTFPIDTFSLNYKPFTDASGMISNPGGTPLYACWVLRIDPTSQITLDSKINNSHFDTLEIKPGKTSIFNLGFSTGLTPTEIDKYFKGEAVGLIMKKERQNYKLIDSTVLHFTAKCVAAPLDTTLSQPEEIITYNLSSNPKTKLLDISLSIDKVEYVLLEIYDDLGRFKAQISDGIFTGGTKVIHYDASTLPSGKYFARLHAGKNILTRPFEFN